MHLPALNSPCAVSVRREHDLDWAVIVAPLLSRIIISERRIWALERNEAAREWCCLEGRAPWEFFSARVESALPASRHRHVEISRSEYMRPTTAPSGPSPTARPESYTRSIRAKAPPPPLRWTAAALQPVAAPCQRHPHDHPHGPPQPSWVLLVGRGRPRLPPLPPDYPHLPHSLMKWVAEAPRYESL